MAYVDHAAEVVVKEGADACNTLQSRPWFAGEWYVFVLAEDGRTVCHPARPEMIGHMAHELVDANGKYFGDEFMSVAAGGGGWVEYMWPRPSDHVPVRKLSYVRSVRAADGRVYVVGSGGYELR